MTVRTGLFAVANGLLHIQAVAHGKRIFRKNHQAQIIGRQVCLSGHVIVGSLIRIISICVGISVMGGACDSTRTVEKAYYVTGVASADEELLSYLGRVLPMYGRLRWQAWESSTRGETVGDEQLQPEKDIHQLERGHGVAIVLREEGEEFVPSSHSRSFRWVTVLLDMPDVPRDRRLPLSEDVRLVYSYGHKGAGNYALGFAESGWIVLAADEDEKTRVQIDVSIPMYTIEWTDEASKTPWYEHLKRDVVAEVVDWAAIAEMQGDRITHLQDYLSVLGEGSIQEVVD